MEPSISWAMYLRVPGHSPIVPVIPAVPLVPKKDGGAAAEYYCHHGTGSNFEGKRAWRLCRHNHDVNKRGFDDQTCDMGNNLIINNF